MTLRDKKVGILWMVFTAFWTAVMLVLIKHLSHTGLNTFIVVALRNVLSLLIFMLFISRLRIPKTTMQIPYFWRGVVGISSMLLWTYALTLIAASEVTALSYTVPIFTALLAISVFKEKLRMHHVIGLVSGIIGTLIVLRPGTEAFHYAGLLVLASSLLWALVNLMIKRFTQTDSTATIVFYTWVMLSLLSIPVAIVTWQTPTLEQWCWIVALGVVSNLAMFSWANAYAKADLVVLMPFDFTRLIFVSVLAYAVFNESVDLLTIIGAIIILCSTTYAAKKEAT